MDGSFMNKFTEAASDAKRTMMENVMNYVAPQVELIEVVVECGFAGTTGGTGDDMNWG